MIRVYPILEPAQVLAAKREAVELVKSGIKMLQLRGGPERDLLRAARELAPAAASAAVLLVVNNRVDIAALTGLGVHLGQRDIPLADARRLLGGHLVIGVSVHSVAEALAAEGADYLTVGPVFPTTSQIDVHPEVGLETLRQVVAALAERGRGSIPVVAIGGIAQYNFKSCLEAGAQYVAAISPFQDEDDPRRLKSKAADIVKRFR